MAPTLVQTASNKAAGTVTVTLGVAATTGNCLVVYIGNAATAARSVSTVKIGGSADNFAKAESKTEVTFADLDCEVWTDQNIGVSSTSVVVTFSGAVTEGYVYVQEWSGIATTLAVDKINGGNGTTGSISSGSSGTLGQASELIVGCALGASAAATVAIAGPGAPWTNLTTLVTGANAFSASYQVVSATTAQTYTATLSGGNGVFGFASVIVTLKAAAGTPHTATSSLTVTPSFANTRVLAHFRTSALTVTPSLTAVRLHTQFRIASLTVTPAFAVTRLQTHNRTATLNVVPRFTNTKNAGKVTALTVTPTFRNTEKSSGKVNSSIVPLLESMR